MVAMMDVPSRTVVADRGDMGQRLDLVLRRHMTGVGGATRTRVQGWIENGHVAINGRPVRRVASRTAFGDVVTIVLPTPLPRATTTTDHPPLSVLFEDDHLLALNKPAGVVVHPAYKHPAGTLLNALRAYASQWPANTRPSLLGRLDRLTSGIIVVAKTASVHARLQATLVSRHATKEYLAVVYGRVNVVCGEIELPLAPDPFDRRRVVVSPADGVPSATRWTRLARVAAPKAGLALLRCQLLTGRKHQIRVHLAARGWPLVGDPTYGQPHWSRVTDSSLSAALRDFPRQALHAWRVAFAHPVTATRLIVEAPVPADLQELLAVSGLR